MDEENFQRAIDIILQNQARFYSDLHQLQEEQKEAKKRADVLERVSVNLYNSSVEQGKSIKELRDSQKETDERFRETDKRFRETDERFSETDERLNAVIFMAEKFFGAQNGKS